MSLVSPDSEKYKSAYLQALLEDGTRALKQVDRTMDAVVEQSKQNVKEAQARKALDNIRNDAKLPISFRKATASVFDVMRDSSLTTKQREECMKWLRELVK